MRKKIHVTALDIKQGVRFNPECCPIALALRRELQMWGEEDICVSRVTIDIEEQRIPTPKSALRFIRKFDEKRPVKPFNFLIPAAVIEHQSEHQTLSTGSLMPEGD